MVRQSELPARLKFRTPGRDDTFVGWQYKGFLSLAPDVKDCFQEHDAPLEFFLDVNVQTGQITLKPKL